MEKSEARQPPGVEEEREPGFAQQQVTEEETTARQEKEQGEGDEPQGEEPEQNQPEGGESSEGKRTRGHVKWFNCTKGFGFITVDETGDEVFVHQSNIETEGFRSLGEQELVEFDLVVGDDGKKKAFHVTGPDGVPPKGHQQNFPQHRGHIGGGMVPMVSPEGGFMPPPVGAFPQQAAGRLPTGGQARNQPSPQAGYYSALPPEAFMGYYTLPPGAGFSYPPSMMPPRGQGGFYPGGQHWAGARPPPPGQPGVSSGLQVVVHNLPWDCTWQQLKSAFAECGDIERADVVFDSKGRSRGFGIVRFPDRKSAELAVEKMNNKTIGGRVVSVRVDRFA